MIYAYPFASKLYFSLLHVEVGRLGHRGALMQQELGSNVAFAERDVKDVVSLDWGHSRDGARRCGAFGCYVPRQQLHHQQTHNGLSEHQDHSANPPVTIAVVRLAVSGKTLAQATPAKPSSDLPR